MRSRFVVSGLLMLVAPNVIDSKSFRGRERKLQQNPCILVRVTTEFKDEDTSRDYLDDSPILCEMVGQDTESTTSYFMPVKGLDDVQRNYVRSGKTTLMAGAAMIQDGELYLPADAGLQVFDTTPDDRRRLSTFGEKRVLVVRASANDSSTSASKEELAVDIFGAVDGTDVDNEGSVNLRSQYAACSYGKLTFQPFQGGTSSGEYVENGVIDVNVDINVLESDRYTVERAITAAASNLVGDLRQFDRVMLCLPPGSSYDSW
jgi:hypothetical protein